MLLAPLVFTEQTIHNGYIGSPRLENDGRRNKNKELKVLIACLAFSSGAMR